MEALISSLAQAGLSSRKASKIAKQIVEDLKTMSPVQCWQKITKTVLSAHYPFDIHALLYKAIYPDWEKLPAPAWLPEEDFIQSTNLAQLMKEKGMKNYADFHHWSVEHYPDFWRKITSLLNIQFDSSYNQVIDVSEGVETPLWFPNAKLNITNSCFQDKKRRTAIISQHPQGKIIKTSYEALDKLSNRIANSLSQTLKKGDKVAIIMPMTVTAVAIFLGVIKAGAVVVAIPDSFSAEEMAMRLQIAEVNIVFCQDYIIRGGKMLPLYERVTAAHAPVTIVLPVEKAITVHLRKKDRAWDNFIVEDDVFLPVPCEPQDHINILFSSGTTGKPKAIPWTQITPIKCGSDAYFHHNIQANDIFCWPSNLGWMMGPWLIFACLLNKATIALYEEAPTGKYFGQFIQDAKVTHLGVVPTIVRTWRATACMEGLHWKAIKLFTSTGERSNIEDMLYLMSLVNYKPVIEYCGGTEIGGAYITGTVIQPNAPAAFTTPALGLDFVLLDEQGKMTNNGEVALLPPSIGLSTEILNNNHHQTYYADMPTLENGKILRRHGDHIARYPNGFYRLLGRIDDTMKLSGIKVGSAEIENVLNSLPGIYETAAVAINPSHGGPSQLFIFAVLKTTMGLEPLKMMMQNAIKQHLNPLFKIEGVVIIPALPRTASNKIMRKTLREEHLSELRP